jgi:hypothetical protein
MIFGDKIVCIEDGSSFKSRVYRYLFEGICDSEIELCYHQLYAKPKFGKVYTVFEVNENSNTVRLMELSMYNLVDSLGELRSLPEFPVDCFVTEVNFRAGKFGIDPDIKEIDQTIVKSDGTTENLSMRKNSNLDVVMFISGDQGFECEYCSQDSNINYILTVFDKVAKRHNEIVKKIVSRRFSHAEFANTVIGEAFDEIYQSSKTGSKDLVLKKIRKNFVEHDDGSWSYVEADIGETQMSFFDNRWKWNCISDIWHFWWPWQIGDVDYDKRIGSHYNFMEYNSAGLVVSRIVINKSTDPSNDYFGVIDPIEEYFTYNVNGALKKIISNSYYYGESESPDFHVEEFFIKYDVKGRVMKICNLGPWGYDEFDKLCRFEKCLVVDYGDKITFKNCSGFAYKRTS